MELGPQSPQNRPATRPHDPSSNGEEEARPSKRPKRAHKHSSSPSFPGDAEDKGRAMKYFAGLKSISDEVEELHRRELEFHVDHQMRYGRLRSMITDMETHCFQQIEERLERALERERQLNAGNIGIASGNVSREPASTPPPQISEPESRNDLRAPHTGKRPANVRAASLAAPSGLIGENGGIRSYTTPPRSRAQIVQGFQHSRKKQLASTLEKNSPAKSPLNANSRFQLMELSEDEAPRPPIGYKGKAPAIDPGAAPAVGALRQDKPRPPPAALSSRWKATRSNSPRHVEPSDGDDEDNGNHEVEAEALPDPGDSEQSLPMGALREDGTFHQPVGVPISNGPPRTVHVEDEASNFSVSLGQHPESSGESSSSDSSLVSLPGRKIVEPLASLSAKNLEVSPFHITPESSQNLPNGTAAVVKKRPTRSCRNDRPGTYNVILDLGSDTELSLQTHPKKNLSPKKAPKGDIYVPEDSVQEKSRSHSPTKPTPCIPPSARKLCKSELGQTKLQNYFRQVEGPAASTVGKPARGAGGANNPKPDQQPRNSPGMRSDEYDDLEADAGSSVGTLQHPPGKSLFTDAIIKSLPSPPSIENPRQAARFSQKVIQKTIGGSPRNLINVVASPTTHDYAVDQYLCSGGNLNPFLPSKPGMHGAMFVFRSGQLEVGSEWHLFASAADAGPQGETHEYFGIYVVEDDTDMPLAEWTKQSIKFKNAWTKEIARKSKSAGGWVHKSLDHWGLSGSGTGFAVTPEQVMRWFNEKEGRGKYARLGRRLLKFIAFDKDLYDALMEKKQEPTASPTTR